MLRDILPGLDPSYLPQAGTDYAGMLRVAAEAFGQSSAADRFLIVLSDGEAHDPGWRAALEELKKKKVKIIGLGIGTSAGALLPDPQGGVMKDSRGAAVLTRLEPSTLEALATETGGIYREASNWVDVQKFCRRRLTKERQGNFRKRGRRDRPSGSSGFWLQRCFCWRPALRWRCPFYRGGGESRWARSWREPVFYPQ